MHAVWISGKATEDPLEAEFLSSFRCKCWTLNVILLLNSLVYPTYTWWSIKSENVGFFCDQVPEWRWVHARSIDQYYTHRWVICIYFLHIFCHFVTSYIGTRIIVRSSTAALRFSANNIFSIRKLECNFFWPHFIVYIFAYGSKIALYCFTVNWRDSFFNRNLSVYN